MDPLEELINDVAEEMNDETVKEILMEESKPVTKTVDDMKDTEEVIFNFFCLAAATNASEVSLEIFDKCNFESVYSTK